MGRHAWVQLYYQRNVFEGINMVASNGKCRAEHTQCLQVLSGCLIRITEELIFLKATALMLKCSLLADNLQG